MTAGHVVGTDQIGWIRIPLAQRPACPAASTAPDHQRAPGDEPHRRYRTARSARDLLPRKSSIETRHHLAGHRRPRPAPPRPALTRAVQTEHRSRVKTAAGQAQRPLIHVVRRPPRGE